MDRPGERDKGSKHRVKALLMVNDSSDSSEIAVKGCAGLIGLASLPGGKSG